VVLVGFVTSEEPPTVDPEPYLFSLLMLVWTGAGEVHSVRTYERMLDAAGFAAPTLAPTPRLPFRVLIAERR